MFRATRVANQVQRFQSRMLATGTVKWFDKTKGFGFIASDESGDVFVHQSSIQMDGFRYLQEGQRVTFDVQDNNGKVSASNVVPEEGADETFGQF